MTPSPRLALFTIAATLAYLGLAILGAGGFAAFFAQPALIALAIFLMLLTGAALFTKGNLSRGEREDRANRWVIAAFGLIGLLAAYLPAYSVGRGSGSSTARLFAGLASCCSPPVVLCGSGRFLCSAGASAGWSRSSPDTHWSPAVFMPSSATPAIWGCSSTRWGGRSLFARVSVYC